MGASDWVMVAVIVGLLLFLVLICFGGGLN